MLFFPNGMPRFYRCGEVNSIKKDSAKYLINNLKIKSFIDLRTNNECLKKGRPTTLINAGIEYANFPLISDADYFRKLRYPSAKDYAQYGISLLEQNTGVFYSIFQLLLSQNNPIIFGCYAGKDRTGLVAALILLAHQVPEQIIIDDYLQTGEELRKNIDYFKENWVKKNLTRKEYIGRMQTREETMTILLNYITNKYNSIFGYLKTIGLTDDDLSLLTSSNLYKHKKEIL